MDVCFNDDTASLDPELLKIPEVSPSAVRANPRVAEELFDQWLSLPETNSLVKSLLNNAKAGGPLNVSGTSFSRNASATNSLPSIFPAGSAPPLSPRSSSGSPRIMKHKAGPSALGSPLKLVNEPVKELIPQYADEEEDINKVLRYFSDEHFYVIYCKFWELDTDHDFLIDKENLIRYGNHALTYRIVDRVFSQVPRKFTSKVEGKMGYEDFVYFILSEEDKSSEPSIEFCSGAQI